MFAALIVGAVWKLGAPVPPVAGPANTEFCAAVDSENVSAGVLVGVAREVVNSGDRFPALKLVTVALVVLQVAQPIAPAELIVIGDVPLNPALPTFAIGIAVGKSATTREKYPGAAVEPVLFPQYL